MKIAGLFVEFKFNFNLNIVKFSDLQLSLTKELYLEWLWEKKTNILETYNYWSLEFIHIYVNGFPALYSVCCKDDWKRGIKQHKRKRNPIPSKKKYKKYICDGYN